jgi:hypothetical protein
MIIAPAKRLEDGDRATRPLIISSAYNSRRKPCLHGLSV